VRFPPGLNAQFGRHDRGDRLTSFGNPDWFKQEAVLITAHRSFCFASSGQQMLQKHRTFLLSAILYHLKRFTTDAAAVVPTLTREPPRNSEDAGLSAARLAASPTAIISRRCAAGSQLVAGSRARILKVGHDGFRLRVSSATTARATRKAIILTED
jgi:hypothetical protein